MQVTQKKIHYEASFIFVKPKILCAIDYEFLDRVLALSSRSRYCRMA